MKITPLADNRFAGILLVEDREAASIRKIHGRRCMPRTTRAADVAVFAKTINGLTGYGPTVAAAPDAGGKHGG
ncbi:MAG: hypothetical protein Q8N06_10640 [Hydrogenophaga sp.]|nr:hypothetical protein [Hydrogenophaga sp.]MDP3419301.1 hypothetical protein [Thiobacillus sp.]